LIHQDIDDGSVLFYLFLLITDSIKQFLLLIFMFILYIFQFY